MEKLTREKNKISKTNIIKNSAKIALLSALILGGAKSVEGKRLDGTTSQKQAIEQLIKEGKLLPNVPTDYGQYGRNYTTLGGYIYNTCPYGDHRQRYQADNLADIDGKDMTIQNDIDSCNFLNLSVYRNNLKRIVPIIIDGQIDTINAARGEYENIDWSNSQDFTGDLTVVENDTNMHANTHANAVANVWVAKPNNFTEEDYDKGLDGRRGREDVGVYPGKIRLYSIYPNEGGEFKIVEALTKICDEAKANPDKRYPLSFSISGGTNQEIDSLLSEIGNLQNIIMLVARDDPISEGVTNTYTFHPATVEVGFVQLPSITMESGTQKINFAGEEKDWVVPHPGTGQTGKMHGDGFSVLGEWSVSEATAYLSAIVANIWAQNPDRTKDEIMDMLKKTVYKSSEYDYDENGWNEWIGYGIVQPYKIMSENIFPEIDTTKITEDSKYYFTVSNFPADYIIQGEGVNKDDTGYSVDLSTLKPGKHTYTFLGQCPYGDSVYTFPISRTLEIAGPEAPMVNDLSGNYKRVNDNPSTGKIRLKDLDGKLTNYQTGDIVDIELNGVKIENIMVNSDGSFDLSGLSNYPFSFDGADIDLKITYTDAEGNKNRTDTKLPVSVLTGKNDMKLSDLKVYPNPVKDILHIDLGSDLKDVMVKIYNVSGKMYEYKQFQSGQNELNLGGLEKGVYFVTITDKSTGMSKTEKIVKL